MNIFYLSSDPVECAKWHYDKHVVKMILEYSQLLSTAHHLLDGTPSIECYKPTHKNHPSAVWVRERIENYQWLYELLKETCKEYTHRYGKVHATQQKGIVDNLWNVPYELLATKQSGVTKMPQCMPDEYKCDDSIMAYRNYYREGKAHLMAYKNREAPKWLSLNLS